MESFAFAYKLRNVQDDKDQNNKGQNDKGQINKDQNDKGQNNKDQNDKEQNNKGLNDKEQNNKGQNDNFAAECHINVWKIDTGKYIFSNTKLYFDFGLMINSEIEWIYVYIPFDFVENGHDFDLIKKLQNNNQLLCTVFNSDYKTEVGQGDTFGKVMDKENNTKFFLHQLGPTKFDIIPFYKTYSKNNKSIIAGKLLRIHIQNAPLKINKIYIRFRIEPTKINDIVKSEHISNDFLQAAFSQIDMYDFRINEIRNISTDVMDKIKEDKYTPFNFDKVHLFYMADTRENVANGSSIKQDSRLLEKDLWETYLPKNCYKRNYIAHHWKKREKKEEMKINENSIIETKEKFIPFNDYRIFFTTIYPKVQLIRLFVYLCIVVLLGWCGSMLSFKISNFLPYSIPEYFKLLIISGMIIVVFISIIVTSYHLIIKLIRK